MIYNICVFLITILIAYMVGLTIVTLVDKRLSNISINLPKQNVIVKYVTEKNSDEIEHFNNYESKYILNKIYEPDYTLIPKIETTICFKDHCHQTCQHGETNYPDPHTMSPIDKRYFKYSYPGNFTLQDYINWLWQYKNTEEELPYEHLKNLNKLKRGIPLIPKKGVLPPPTKFYVEKDTASYFKKLYGDEINLSAPLDTELYGLEGYNCVQYPGPVILYPKYKHPNERKVCEQVR